MLAPLGEKAASATEASCPSSHSCRITWHHMTLLQMRLKDSPQRWAAQDMNIPGSQRSLTSQEPKGSSLWQADPTGSATQERT